MEKVLLSVFTLWLTIEGSVSVTNTTPPTVDGTLTACADQQLTLTCSHDNVISGNTRWIVGPPVNCTSDISHSTGTATSCEPFMFQGITRVESTVTLLSSTAVATATVNMTGANIECRGGNLFSSFSVGNISLCVVGQLPPPTNFECENITNGLNVSWDAVSDTSCAMSSVGYHVTVIRKSDMMTIFSMPVTETTTEITSTQGLQPNTTYSILLQARTIVGTCGGELGTITCETSASVPIATTTQPPNVPMTDSSQGSMPPSVPSTGALSTEAIIGIVVGVIFIAILNLVIVIVVVVIKKSQGDRKGNDHAPLKTDTEQQQGPVYAMVDKPKKTQVEQPTYQTPNSIERVQTPAGVLYTKPQQRIVKGKNQGSSVDPESAPEYSVVQKKDQQLTYAAIQVDKGNNSGQQQATDVLYSDIQQH